MSKQEEYRMFSEETYQLAQLVRTFFVDDKSSELSDIEKAEQLLQRCENHLNATKKADLDLKKKCA